MSPLPSRVLTPLLAVLVGKALLAQVQVTLTAAPGTVQIAPGVSRAAWLYNGQLPGPLLRVRSGQTLRVRVVNQLPEETTVHWHGVPLPSGMDGVPGVSRPPIEPGQEFTYEFTAGPPGTYFYHPHVGVQIDRGLYGMLIVDPAGPGDPPFDRELQVVLDEWNEAPWDILINGRSSAGQTPLLVRQGERVRIRLLNASAASSYTVALDGHPLTVTHADGRRVQPVTVEALSIGAGERYDVLVQATNPGQWSLAAAFRNDRTQTVVRAIVAYEGAGGTPPAPGYVPPFLRSGTLLSYAALASAEPVAPIQPQPARTYNLTLSGGMMGNIWTINGQAWPSADALPVQSGESVRLRFTNMSMMDHPMHLHGHFFRLLDTAGGITNPPAKDTILIPAGGMASASVEFVADNPGAWMLHCHNLYHAEAGMMRLVKYVNGDADQDGLPDGEDLDPLSPWPVLTTNGLTGGYRLGTPMRLDAWWPAGEVAACFAGAELDPELPLGLLGALRLRDPVFLGAARAGSGHVGQLALSIPADPSLRGARIALQAVASHATLPPGARLSTRAIVTLP